MLKIKTLICDIRSSTAESEYSISLWDFDIPDGYIRRPAGGQEYIYAPPSVSPYHEVEINEVFYRFVDNCDDSTVHYRRGRNCNA
ncbi:uncharacterized protein LAJ45_10477 [Morchella importuna]|uniref:uncharacterized protein n=1 Tax=Morchella importuna TaxID=1174673 RepID=UPI001E8E90BC|nr:uncharacterized protein LAJ45_10477 [Morchella importuna]KAH8145507.1 hypothetical protein LAJ45_10477 [Morchella importuna]